MYRKLTRPKIWEGVYSDFKEVEIEGEGLDGDIWADIVERETREIADALSNGGAIPALLKGENSLLPLLVSVVSQKEGIKILDFGGGAGVDFFHLKSALDHTDNIEFHIVESEKICQRGRAIHQNNPGIVFHESLPVDISTFDIVHIDSVLQYIENYPSLLDRLFLYRPLYFLFVILCAGDIPAYVTRQKNVRGISCPHRFINIRELVHVMNKCGYALVFKNAGDLEYDQDNFPVEYRMGHSCNLLFIRSEDVVEANSAQ